MTKTSVQWTMKKKGKEEEHNFPKDDNTPEMYCQKQVEIVSQNSSWIEKQQNLVSASSSDGRMPVRNASMPRKDDG